MVHQTGIAHKSKKKKSLISSNFDLIYRRLFIIVKSIYKSIVNIHLKILVFRWNQWEERKRFYSTHVNGVHFNVSILKLIRTLSIALSKFIYYTLGLYISFVLFVRPHPPLLIVAKAFTTVALSQVCFTIYLKLVSSV